ncbi:serine/threonine-protein kinase [Streptomyces sp. HNM0574]|uniref:serine/threonine-protein kinase n=1 Tax=Streptomyces sp. HNM0574 TaxID=2714954 RepID=UPI00146CA070|nr:serine/threonine-protein kinase [Streptomyces sp. HNM0574]NLU67612.1 serine/threonine protein kinase [Streptomyces sp. HNM0574]
MAGGSEGQIVDGRFELLEQLGRGGMGTVWRARDTALHRDVALKEVRPTDPELGRDGSGESEGSRMLRERVLREARALARLSSDPHVVTIHHIVDERPYPWLVMELLPGSTLQDRLREGPIPPREAARTGLEVLSALRTAHAAGIQHRDVKPANVLLRADGSAVLTDFGIAALQGSTTLTATGDFLGSPEFMAPERIRGRDEDPSADLWSLGMTLYVCTEGHSPLRRGTSLATLAAVLDEPLPPPVRSGELTPVLQALLVRDREQRPSAEELHRMLTAAAEGRTPQAAPGAYFPTQDSGRPHAVPGPPPGAYGPAPAPHTPPAPTPHDAQQQPYGGGPTGPMPDGRSRQPGNRALVTTAAVLAAALVAGVTYLLATPSGGTETGGAGGGTVSAQPEETPKSPEQPSRDPEAPPSEGVSDPEHPERPKERPGDGPDKPGPDRPDQSVRGEQYVNSWVAQLASVPKADGKDARARQQDELDKKVDGARWLDSDKFASLRPGYWFFYRPGGFGGGKAAARWCAEHDMPGADQCVGRYLSHDKADRVYICAPDKSRGTGRCERD